jgi:abortive infection bacteriophage resistance protein
MKYSKPALTVDDQIALLEGRGMAFGDRGRATFYLREINYYRLRGYWLRRETDRTGHQFPPGTAFEDVLADYVFDRELRLLVLDAIERIEVSVRTRWAHVLGMRHGPHAHLDSPLFRDRSQTWNHPEAVAGLIRTVEQSREVFMQHLRKTYDELLPPIWAVVEVMSLGQISRWADNLRHAANRNAVAEGYGLDEALLMSALHHLSVVRNICAHHARLWDRHVAIRFQLPRKHPAALIESLSPDEAASTYNTLVIVGWLVASVSPEQTWVARVADHVDSHGPARAVMGFPGDFRRRPVWQGAR